MRGILSVLCNDIAKRIWEFTQNRGFWISSHIRGVEKTMREKMSRIFNDSTEWMLSHKSLKFCVTSFSFTPRLICLPPISISK